MGGLGRTIAEGMAWGTGTAIAREAVHGVMGAFSGSSTDRAPAAPAPASQPHAVQTSGPAGYASGSDPCAWNAKQFTDCMSVEGGNFAACEPLFQAMQQCKMQTGSASFAN